MAQGSRAQFGLGIAVREVGKTMVNNAEIGLNEVLKNLIKIKATSTVVDLVRQAETILPCQNGVYSLGSAYPLSLFGNVTIEPNHIVFDGNRYPLNVSPILIKKELNAYTYASNEIKEVIEIVIFHAV